MNTTYHERLHDRYSGLLSPVPRDRLPDSTVALLRDPYGFISKRCQYYGSDLFETRLLLRRTLCMTGRDAAALFYDPELFARRGAVPARIQRTLFGRGGVQGLDGDAHIHRKRMFMSLMTPERIADLVARVDVLWDESARRWQAREELVFYGAVQELLARAACAWAGVPLAEEEVERRTRQLSAMFDYAGAIGPAHGVSRSARRGAERWIARLVAQIRKGQIEAAPGTAADVIAAHRDLDGLLLSPQLAAVELINVLRPIVAGAVFIVDSALALHRHPSYRDSLMNDGELELFVQEVRRYYPFFPWAGAVVREPFVWRGYHFPRGRRVLLDIYGIDHDPRIWRAPEQFRPERFRLWDGDPFGFIPQGGGDHYRNHRCAGEWVTIALMKSALRFLSQRVSYRVPEQDLALDRRRLPALPRSRFIISGVRVVG